MYSGFILKQSILNTKLQKIINAEEMCTEMSKCSVVVVVGALFAGANIGGTADQTPPSCAILCRLQQLVC